VNPDYYYLETDILELKINEDYIENIITDPIIYQLGGDMLSLSDEISQLIQGYISLAQLASAIPNSIVLESLPACGVLTRVGVEEDEYSFALFWSYTVES